MYKKIIRPFLYNRFESKSEKWYKNPAIYLSLIAIFISFFNSYMQFIYGYPELKFIPIFQEYQNNKVYLRYSFANTGTESFYLLQRDVSYRYKEFTTSQGFRFRTADLLKNSEMITYLDSIDVPYWSPTDSVSSHALPLTEIYVTLDIRFQTHDGKSIQKNISIGTILVFSRSNILFKDESVPIILYP